MIDNNQADDKIVAILNNDALYQGFNDIADVPVSVVDRLKHYFLTYKDLPGNPADVQITHMYNKDEALDLIERSINDYKKKFENLDTMLSAV